MIFRIRELQDLFVDACVRFPNGDLAFLSFYGRDGSVQQLFASLQLGTQEGGLRQLTLVTASSSVETVISIGESKGWISTLADCRNRPFLADFYTAGSMTHPY